jgi:hypothetical protein
MTMPGGSHHEARKRYVEARRPFCAARPRIITHNKNWQREDS